MSHALEASQTRPPAGRQRFRLTIQTLMATVAVVAFDCFVLISTDGGGVLLAGTLLTVGFICWRLSRGWFRRFWFGCEIAGVAAILSYVGLLQIDHRLAFSWPDRVLNFGLAHFSWVDNIWDDLESGGSQLAPILLFELSYGLPILLIAIAGGIAATIIRPPAPTATEPAPVERGVDQSVRPAAFD